MSYTTHDVNGNTVHKGDTVILVFTGKVLSVERDGHLVIRNDKGVYMTHTDGYATLVKQQTS